jgi:hypothetical protein
MPLAAGWLTHEYTQLGSCHGPAGGAPAAGAGGGVPTERIPRDKPPNLARRGEIKSASYASCRSGSIPPRHRNSDQHFLTSCEPLPNHVLPLAHFGAISDVFDGGVVRTDHHNDVERSGST